MQIVLSGHHLEITEALRRFVNEKMQRISRHFDNVTNVYVTLSVEKQRHRAEAKLHIAGSDLHADSVATDMYAAIDDLVDKVDRQVKKHKEKMVDKHRSEKVRRFDA